MARVLMVDDDRDLCSLVCEYLTRHGFDVDAVYDGRSALQRLEQGIGVPYEAVLLDIEMPPPDGLDVLRRLRPNTTTPVIIMSSRGEDMDRVLGLELGADDYMPKPANPREIVARLQAVLRRTTGSALSDLSAQGKLRIGDAELDAAARRVFVGGHEIPGTGAEFDVLHLLVRNAGSVVGRDSLSRMALGRPASALDRSIDTHVSRLRRKLGPNADGSDRLRTIRNAGYVFVPSNAGVQGIAMAAEMAAESRGEVLDAEVA